MKKLFALAIATSLIGGLYGLTLSFSGAYQDVTDEYGAGAYFGAKVDAIVSMLPILKARGYLAEVDFKDPDMTMSFGTFTGSDLLLSIPMPAAIQPYVVAGILFIKDDKMVFKGGLGAEMGFGNLYGYLEGNINFISPYEGDGFLPINIMGGIRIPVKLGF